MNVRIEGADLVIYKGYSRSNESFDVEICRVKIAFCPNCGAEIETEKEPYNRPVERKAIKGSCNFCRV